MEKNVPTLRFPEFEGEWERTRIEEIASSTSSGRSKNSEESGEFPFYGSTGIISYSNSFDYSGEKILIARVGANAGSLYKVSGNYKVSDNTLILDLASLCKIDFVANYLLKKKLNKLVFGSGQPLITGGQLKQFKLFIPSLPEQTKIANFLTAVDDRISRLKKKKELLEQYKKGVMQRIFAGRDVACSVSTTNAFRFKDENGEDFPEWEEKYGDDVFENVSDKNHNSDLPILAITQEHGAIPRDMIDYNISVTDKSIESYKVVQIGDFIISLRSFQGGIEYSNYKGICSPAYIILRPKIGANRNFFKYYLKTETYIKELNRNLEGIRDGKMVSYKYFSDIGLPFPSLPEQTKIANFLSAIDAKISHCGQQIESMERWKKGLLQQLFV